MLRLVVIALMVVVAWAILVRLYRSLKEPSIDWTGWAFAAGFVDARLLSAPRDGDGLGRLFAEPTATAAGRSLTRLGRIDFGEAEKKSRKSSNLSPGPRD